MIEERRLKETFVIYFHCDIFVEVMELEERFQLLPIHGKLYKASSIWYKPLWLVMFALLIHLQSTLVTQSRYQSIMFITYAVNKTANHWEVRRNLTTSSSCSILEQRLKCSEMMVRSQINTTWELSTPALPGYTTVDNRVLPESHLFLPHVLWHHKKHSTTSCR